MIKLNAIKKKDVGIIIKIVNMYDKKESPLMKIFFNYYFKKGTFENKYCRAFSIFYENKIVGIIGYTNRVYSRYYELEWFFIDDEYTNKGIGSESLRQLEIRIKGLLVVQTGFEKAVKFYKKNGFKLYGKITKFYGKENSWFLVKKFN